MESVCDYTLMVTGITGNGKSSFCNFLSCSNTAFETGSGFASITDKSAAAIITMQGVRLKLIDTPGFCDDYDDEEEHMKEFGEALVLASKGVNAIALVISAKSRYTTNEKTTIELSQFQELWPFMFIIFTHANSLGTSEEEQRKKLQLNFETERCPAALKVLMQQVSNRYIVIESVKRSGNPEEYYQTKTKELHTMISAIHKAANYQVYSNELFISTKELLDKLAQENAEAKEQLKMKKSETEENIKKRLEEEKAKEEAKLKAQMSEDQQKELEKAQDEKRQLLLEQEKEKLLQKENEKDKAKQERDEVYREKERLEKELEEKKKIKQEALEALKKQLKEEREKQEMLKEKAEESKEQSSKKWYRFLFKKSTNDQAQN